MNFRSDGDGGRVKKTTPTITTTYIGSLYESSLRAIDIENVNGEAISKKHIFLGSTRICSINNKPSTINYYHPDHLGSSNLITDDTGQAVQLFEYTPYGSFSSSINYKPSTINHYYTGKELDDSTGLYYYGARYYDAELGRFTQADTVVQAPFDPQTLNRYSYCRNNPINYADPSGLSWKKFWNKVGDFFSGIGQGIAANPGAFVAGLAVGIFAAWAIAPMISSLSGAMAASGAGVTFGEGFILGGLELGIPAFSGTLAGGLAGGEKFSVALKNAAIVGGATFVTAGLIEGSYAAGWQKSIHFRDVRADSVRAQMDKYNSLALEGRFQEAMDVKTSLMKNYDFYGWGTIDIAIPAYQHVDAIASKTSGGFAGVKFDWVGKNNPLNWGKVLTSNAVKGQFMAIDKATFIKTEYRLLIFRSASPQTVNNAISVIPTLYGKESNYILYGIGTHHCYQGAAEVDSLINRQ